MFAGLPPSRETHPVPTVFAKVRCVHRRAQCRALRRAEQGIALRIQKQDGHVAVAGDRLFELADFLLVGIGRRLEDAVHRGADLLQVADILLGKVLFNGMQHKPGKGEKASMVERLIKRSAAAQARRASEGLTRIRHLQHIAHAAHRLDQLRFKIVIDFARRRFTATSIAFVSLSKFMSHTWEAIRERGSTSP
jgi:hypothetical protein